MSKILIVEDDPITAQVYSAHLVRAGYAVEVAVNAGVALKALHEYQPEGLLIDFMMPGMNGLDLVRAIRKEPGFEDVPIIIYSNAVLPMVVEQAKAAGVSHIFDKSNLNPGQLVQAFETAKLRGSPIPRG